MSGSREPANTFWAGRTVLCTGATGVVGSWVSQALFHSGARVVALIRDADRRSHFFRSGMFKHACTVNGDLQDYRTVERAIVEYDVDTVIHLGAQTIVTTAQRAPLETFEANIRGTYNVLEACRIHSELVQRVVVASSDKAYGDHGNSAYSEDAPLAANHPYDVSKACGDLLAQTYAHSYGLPVAIARCGNIYGGGDLNWSRIVPGTIRALWRGQRPQIRSDGTFVRDYLYVKDAAQAYLCLARRAADDDIRGQAFNFSGEAPKIVLEVVDVIRRLMGRTEIEPAILNVASNEIPYQALNACKAQSRLDWKTNFQLEDGLEETINWYRSFLEDEVRAHPAVQA